MAVTPLSAQALRQVCDPADLDFATTADLPDLEGVVGQARATEALEFGIGMARPGFNIYALGPDGLHKHGVVRHHLQQAATAKPGPPDYCYVNGFADPHRPAALKLPRGRGAAFKRDADRVARDLRDALKAAFESEDYRTRRGMLEQELKERQENAIEAVSAEAREMGVALQRTPMGFAFVPVTDAGILSPKAFHELPEAEQRKIQERIETMQERLETALKQVPEWVKEMRERVRTLNEETADRAVADLIGQLKASYNDLPEVVKHLDAMHADIVANIAGILHGGNDENNDALPAHTNHNARADARLRPYMANLLVDNAGQDSAPVVYEDEPSFERLIGRIEHRAEMGALTTDFLLIRPGALHRANGGYLILDAHKVLTQPFAWEALKRALRAGEIRIEPPYAMLGLFSTTTLEPDPVPLDVKVVLVGERLLYNLLSALDPEFPQLFKVAADFTERTARTPETNRLYARVIATLARRENLLALDRGAVARVLEEAARAAEDAERLSTRVEDVADLIREADYWRRRAGDGPIDAAAVDAAVAARERRHDRLRERLQEEIARGTVLIEADGRAVGQINALTVLQLSHFAFGHPARVTARVGLGRGDVLDIERTVKLGGPIHSKGVLILGGFLRGRFARGDPLSLSASLVFEQSYGGIEGDSASLAELLALLSAIAELPLRQDLAVTGSLNQHGTVQPIGGVNEKVEGFFDVCAARGLTGQQGVVIPAANVKHLMLAPRVLDAVRGGHFAVYSVAHADDAVRLFFDREAGEADADGRYPEGTVNRAVGERLREFARERRSFGPAPGAGDDGSGGEAGR